MISSTPWRAHGATPPETHIFTIGDVHGQARALAELLDHIDKQPRPTLKREMIFLGDLIDRGPDSIGSVHLAWDAKDRVDRHRILPGNHELMMLDTMADPNQPGWDIWYINGGKVLLTEVDPFEDMSFEQAVCAVEAALPEGFLRMLKEDVSHIRRGGFLFVHAGIDPHRDLEITLSQPGLSSLLRPDRERHWAWIREPFVDWTGPWPDPDVNMVVHGHTPVTYQAIVDFATTEQLMCPGFSRRRVCLDIGSAARLPQIAAMEILGDKMRFHITSEGI